MNRLWFAQGLRGMIAKRIQVDLLKQGYFVGSPEKFVDGVFGNDTVSAMKRLQADRSLMINGNVDESTWHQLTVDPLPTLFERCMSITAEFEGHGFGLVQGNFDGAGLTWGVIGFTLSNGEIQLLLAKAESAMPGTLDRVFGKLAVEWRRVVAMPRTTQVSWADSISSGSSKANLPIQWKNAFSRLGEEPIIKRLQLQRAYDEYFVPAAKSALRLNLLSELGVALMFDCHVQNGKSRLRAVEKLLPFSGKIAEQEMRLRLAHSIADHSAIEWQADVLGRKTVIALGQARFRGREYILGHWGLGETPAS